MRKSPQPEEFRRWRVTVKVSKDIKVPDKAIELEGRQKGMTGKYQQHYMLDVYCVLMFCHQTKHTYDAR
jgi:hypothetical protein